MKKISISFSLFYDKRNECKFKYATLNNWIEFKDVLHLDSDILLNCHKEYYSNETNLFAMLIISKI